MKIISYELNEVSWKVIDYYIAHRKNSHLASFLKTSSELTTLTTDSGELHPWSTWPTMHRGVNNDLHEIRFINQDLGCANSWPPLWELLANGGVRVGICGCLQSFPPLQHQNILFHIPDTFAPGADTVPAKYSGFQKINLKLTGDNKAVAKPLDLKDLRDGLGLYKAGVSLKTGLHLGRHLCREHMNPLFRSMRATMQAHVAFDVFMDAMKETKPDYAAVFSNHVAGTMHRYWKYAFPEDFNYTVSDSGFDKFHSQSVLRAMDIFDSQLGTLWKFADKHGYDLIIASSMGQEAIDRGTYRAELRLDDEAVLAEQMGWVGAFKMNLAMQPDVNFGFNDKEELTRFKQELGRLRDPDGNQVLTIRYEEQGLSLNLMTCRSESAWLQKTLFLDDKPFSLAELGFAAFKRDPGTGYHQPEGILIWQHRNRNITPTRDRRIVDSRQYAPSILQAFDLVPPAYMMQAAPLDAAETPFIPEEAKRGVA